MMGAKPKTFTKKSRAVHDKHAAEYVAATLHCLTACVGARRAAKARASAQGPLLFPNTPHTTIDNKLRAIKKLPVPAGGWTKETVSKALYPQQQHQGTTLLTLKEEGSLCQLILTHARTNKGGATRNMQRKYIRTTLRERARRAREGRDVVPLSVAAKLVVRQPSGVLKLPTDLWFSHFVDRHRDQGLRDTHTQNKDVQRVRSTDANTLEADITELVGDLTDLGITTPDGRWVAHPGADDDGKLGRTPGFCSRAKVIQTDEKGEFLFYDRDKARMARIKVTAAAGCPAFRVACENRERYTYVPWADATPRFLFAQVIFKGAQVMEQHLCWAAAESNCILLQYTASGQQTDETFAEAIEFCFEIRKIICHGHPIICLTIASITTDGHFSRKGALACAVAKRCHTEIQLRGAFKGGSSWITQMWDQIFAHYHNDIVKITESYVADHNCHRKNDYDVFKMTKKHILAATATQHAGGHAGWVTPGQLAMAFAVCGFLTSGVSLQPLLDNAAVQNSATKVTGDTRFARANTLPASATQAPTRPAAWRTPERLQGARRTTAAYFAARLAHAELERDSYKKSPQDIMEATAESLQLDPCQAATVAPVAQEIHAALDRGNKRAIKPPGANRGNATGLINRLQWFCDERADSKADRDAKQGRKRAKSDVLQELLVRYKRCQLSDACVCGADACVQDEYFCCRGCDDKGRAALQKSVCRKGHCEVGRNNPAAGKGPKHPPKRIKVEMAAAAVRADSEGRSVEGGQVVAGRDGTTHAVPVPPAAEV